MQTSILWLEIHQTQVTAFWMVNQFLSQSTYGEETLALFNHFKTTKKSWTMGQISPCFGHQKVNVFHLQGGGAKPWFYDQGFCNSTKSDIAQNNILLKIAMKMPINRRYYNIHALYMHGESYRLWNLTENIGHMPDQSGGLHPGLMGDRCPCLGPLVWDHHPRIRHSQGL